MGDREAGKGLEMLGGFRWAETFWWQGDKQHHGPLGSLSLCWGMLYSIMQEDHGMALALANGWEHAWRKNEVFSFSLG